MPTTYNISCTPCKPSSVCSTKHSAKDIIYRGESLSCIDTEAGQNLELIISRFCDTLQNISSNSGVSGVTEVTYAQLMSLIGANQLSTGSKYLITDYQTVHTIPNTTDTNTGTVEPLLVTAISTNELAPEAYSALFPDDIKWITSSKNFESSKIRLQQMVEYIPTPKPVIEIRTDFPWKS